MFNTDSGVFRTLTENEVSQIPKHILNKIKIELQNQTSLYKTHNEINLKKIEEYRKILKEKEDLCLKQCKENRHIEMKYFILYAENKINESRIESLRSEILFLKKNYQQLVDISRKNEEKVSEDVKDIDCEKDYKNKKEEIDSIFKKINLKKKLEDSSDSTLDCEKKNKKLLEKINDLKKQIDYLLNSTNKKKESLEGKKKIELIKIIQSVTLENEELKKNKITEKEVKDLKKNLEEKNYKIEELEYEKKNLMELYERSKSKNKMIQDHLLSINEDYERICVDKQNIFDQLNEIYRDKIRMEHKINDLIEDLETKDLEISTLRSDLKLFSVTKEKLEEVTDELRRIGDRDKEKRVKIQELTKKLEESENKYNKYILSNKSDIVAILGNELSFINKKIERYVKDFLDINDIYVVYKEEQDKLFNIYKEGSERCKMVDDENISLKYKIEEFNSFLSKCNMLINEIKVQEAGIYNDMFFIYEIVDNMSIVNKRIIDGYKNESNMYRNDILNKENIIRSLVEDENGFGSTFIKNENEMLRKEVSYLRNKMDNMENNEIEELTDKIDKYKLETDSLREYISNLSVEVYDKNQELKAYENNLTQLAAESEKKEKLIKKYELIIGKLRIIKDEYVKLRTEMKKKREVEDQETPKGDVEESTPQVLNCNYPKDGHSVSKDLNNESRNDKDLNTRKDSCVNQPEEDMRNNFNLSNTGDNK